MELSIKFKLIIAYVEDPGAANFIFPLISHMDEIGCKLIIYSEGTAKNYLQSKNIETKDIHLTDIDSILRDEEIKAILVGTSENSESIAFKIIDSALSKKVPVIGVIDGPANVQYRFRGSSNNAFNHKPDWLITIDEWTKNEYVKLGFESEKIFVSGHPYYEFLEKKLKENLSKKEVVRKKLFSLAGNNKKVVVFLTEKSTGLNSQSFVYSEKYSLKGWGDTKLRTKIVLEEFIDGIDSIRDEVYLVLRLHPKESINDYIEYKKYFDTISAKEDSLKILISADLIVGLTSSLLAEASVLGLNVLSILPVKSEVNDLSTIREGLTPYVSDRSSISRTLQNLLNQNYNKDNKNKNTPVSNVVDFINKICN